MRIYFPFDFPKKMNMAQLEAASTLKVKNEE